MNWLTIVVTIFDIAWLIAALALLWRIYITSEERLKHVKVLEKTLLEVSSKDAESARKAVDAVYALIDVLQKDPKK